jgi:hypothetical protein
MPVRLLAQTKEGWRAVLAFLFSIFYFPFSIFSFPSSLLFLCVFFHSCRIVARQSYLLPRLSSLAFCLRRTPPSLVQQSGKEPFMSTRAARKTNHSSAKSQTKSPIRIVPLHPYVRDAAAPAPNLTYRNGPLLTNVEVFTLFWGAAWQDLANTQLSQQMNSFFDFILTSPLLDQLAEYSAPGKSIGHGKRTGTNILTSPDPGKTVQDSAIQSLLKSELASGTIPPANANSLYFVFLPPGTQVKQGGSASCKDFCGYHDATPDGVFYAVMPYPGCAGCVGGLTLFPALTSTSSHELCEAITDPIPGQGWYDDNNGEIGDICAWKTRQLGLYTVQLEWSNSAGSCI